jgi:Uma2 family endonuclease
MSMQKTLLTADEFYDFCCKNDGRYELVDGEVVELSPVNDEHSGIASNIVTAFNNYSRRRGFGQAGVEAGYIVLSGPDTVRGPDVSFRLVPRNRRRQSAGFLSGAPDIAVEVVSPSNTTAEMERKVREYLAAGSQRVWVVYPATPTSARRVAVHRADGGVITYTGDDVITDEELLPGFSLPLAEIFE